MEIRVRLKALFAASRQGAGSRTRVKKLREEGISTRRWRVVKLMQEEGLVCRQRRAYKVGNWRNTIPVSPLREYRSPCS
ncbi:IS3 family transposase [Escherichia coli]|uniref:IS3 family transposase n=1 Tax=Escherichia coli TaxID=562 RepID=UPI003F684D17